MVKDPKSTSNRPAGLFRHQVRDFLRFVLRLDLRRGPGWGSIGGLGNGWYKDWRRSLDWRSLFKWAGFLWVVNLFVLAPIAFTAAQGAQAEHRLDGFSYSLIVMAVLWAPLFEELLFRYSLRRPSVALWLVPILVFVLWQVRGLFSLAVVVAMLLLLLVVLPYLNMHRQRWVLPFAWRRAYRRHFGVFAHLSVFSFAYVHIHNYEFDEIGLLVSVMMITPQWFSGLALLWMRVRYGIFNAMLLHGLFNAGPVLLLLVAHWLAIPMT